MNEHGGLGAVIQLSEKQNIILMYVREGKSKREIASITGFNRRTVTKYMDEYIRNQEALLNVGPEQDASILIEEIVKKPTYQGGDRKKRKLTPEMLKSIEQHLEENEIKRLKGQHKQLKRAVDIHEAICSSGADISYSTIRTVVSELLQKKREAFIKCEYDPGDVCEFDWGTVRLTIGGELREYQMAVFTSAYGNYRFAVLFQKQKTECFQEAHALFFAHVGQVYRTMVYDNMRVAVKQFVGNEKLPTEGMLQLSLHYGFQFRFCNVYSGNEKGHVERSVEVIRRKAFAFRDVFESLDEANAYLQSICDKRNHKPQPSRQNQSATLLLEVEKARMLPLPPKFDASRMLTARVDKYSTVTVDQNHYSVPDRLVGKTVMVKVDTVHVRCFFDGAKIAEHRRLNGLHEWRLTLEHYFETFMKKPGAVAASTALHQAHRKTKNIFETYYTKQPREFVVLLQWMQQEDISLTEVEQAIGELRKMHPNHVTTDKIKLLCAKRRETPKAILQKEQQTKEIETQAQRHLNEYADLFGTTSEDQEVAA